MIAPVRAKKARLAKPQTDKYFARAVGKALEILQFLRAAPNARSLAEVAEFAGMNKTSAFRLLHTLTTAGYLDKNTDGTFMAPKNSRTQVPAEFAGRLIRAAGAVMKDLGRETQETVSLAALFENHMEVVSVVESPQTIRMSNIPGRILPPNASSLGKAITAFQSEDRRESLMRCFGLYPFTACTLVDSTAIEAEFALTRKRGYSMDYEESVAGGHCFGAPIKTYGAVLASVSISMPKDRVPEGMPALIKRAALQIASAMGPL